MKFHRILGIEESATMPIIELACKRKLDRLNNMASFTGEIKEKKLVKYLQQKPIA